MHHQKGLQRFEIFGPRNEGNSLFFHTANTFLATLGPFIAVFTILRIENIDTWGALALGQAIGLLSSIFVSLGTNVNGSNEISSSDESQRAQLFLKISFLQVLAIIPASAISFLASFLFTNSNSLLAGLGSISVNFIALTVSWFFFGRGEPKKLLMVETLPRFLITLFSLLVFINTENIYVQIFLQIFLNFLLYVVTVIVICKQYSVDIHSLFGGNIYSIQYKLRIKSSSIALVSCLNSISPIMILSLAANTVLPNWAAVDKVTRYFSILNQPLTNRYRNLLNNGKIHNLRTFFLSRMFTLHLISGSILSLSLFLSGPNLISALSSNKIFLDHLSFLPISLSLFINLSVRSPAFLLLASRNELSGILRSLSLTFLISVPVLYFLGINFAFSGACIGVLILSILNAMFYLLQINSQVSLKR